MTSPDVRVEIAFNSGYATPEGDRVWTDISDKVLGWQGIPIVRGRQNEQSQPTPSTVSVTLDNRGGEFTPENLLSEYYPNVRLGRPLRVTVIYDLFESVRVTAYINEWPVVWPEGNDLDCQVTVSAASRRARMGRTDPMSSAIRTAYLSTSPEAVWPLDEDPSVVYFRDNNRPGFRDITNTGARSDRQTLAVWYENDAVEPATEALRVVQLDGTPGPNDELSLVHFPAFADIDLLGTLPHYIGTANAVSLNSAGELTMEAVARFVEKGDLNLATAVEIRTSDNAWAIVMTVGLGGVNGEIMYRDPQTGALLDSQFGQDFDAYAVATDGQIHHYLMTLTAGNVARFYFDGVLLHTLTLDSPYVFNRRFVHPFIGGDTYNLDTWVGWVGAHDRALTDAEVLTRATAATTASETLAARVKRIAAHSAVPPDEVYVEDSIAAPLGRQVEAGRAPVEVLEQIGVTTGGTLFDDRLGPLVLQARNHRYNAPLEFVLSVDDEEVEPDLAPALDDQLVVNDVVVTVPTDDGLPIQVRNQESIDDIGTYGASLAVVAAKRNEAEAAGLNILTRRSVPRQRVVRVSVDLTDLAEDQRAAVLLADIGSKFGIVGLPGQAPALAMPLFIEGYNEALSTGRHVITFNTSPGDMDDVWVLGHPVHSVLGSTTRPAY